MPQSLSTPAPEETLACSGDGRVTSTRPRSYPLSRSQWRLWYQQATQPDDSALNLRLATRLRNEVTTEQARAAVAAVVGRHEVLRTVITAEAGQAALRQLVLADLTSPIGVIRHPSGFISEDQLAESATRWASVPFDLERETPFRAAVLVGPHERALGLQFAVHHVCWDAFSTGLLWREIAAGLTGAAPSGPPVPYGEFAVLESTVELERLRTAAVRQAVGRIADHPVLPAASTEHPDGLSSSDDSSSIRFELDAGRLDSTGQSGQPTAFVVLVAAVARSLFRVFGRTSVLLALDISLRGELERFDDTIGMFQNQVIGRLADGPDQELLDRAQLCVLQALEDRWAPYDEVVRELGWSGMLDGEPFDAKVWFDRCEPGTDDALAPVLRWAETVRHDLTFGFTVYPDATVGCTVSARPTRYRAALAALYREFQASLRILLGPAADPADSLAVRTRGDEL